MSLPLRFDAASCVVPAWLDGATQASLLHAASTARAQAYAPYSRFAVGAALLDVQGRIHSGCNVENAAYPQGLCAEACALAQMVLAGATRFRAALVLGAASAPQWVTPCGGCRQKLREFGAEDSVIVMARVDTAAAGVVAQAALAQTLGQLLPLSFGPQHLDLN